MMVEQKDWKKLNWTAKITENVQEFDKMKNKETMKISGVAISASTSRNGVTYEASELAVSAITLKGKPLMMDHTGSVRDIVGRVIMSIWNESTESIEFVATVMEPEIEKMLKDGRITDVSIGAKVNDLKKNKDGTVSAIGIEFLELSLVAIPGIVDQGITSINQAIKKNLILKEKLLGKPNVVIETLDLNSLDKLDRAIEDIKVRLIDNSEIKSIEVRL